MRFRTSWVACLAAFSLQTSAWTQYCEQSDIVASQPRVDEKFGRSVAIDGDIVAVAAPYERSNLNDGRVILYRRQGAQWIEEAELSNGIGGQGDDFGFDMSLQGDLLAVGVPAIDGGGIPGSVVVFRNTGGTWAEEIRLQASDASPGDRFGASLELDPALPGRRGGG